MGMVRGGALSVPCLDPAAYLIYEVEDETFVNRKEALQINVIN